MAHQIPDFSDSDEEFIPSRYRSNTDRDKQFPRIVSELISKLF